jgi:hypothetical protein
MLIYIPSTQRATEANIRMGPLLRLPREWQEQTRYVVPQGQGQEYRMLLTSMATNSDLGHSPHVLETPADVVGIAQTRHWIATHARSVGEDLIVQMDDDIDFLIRKSPEDWSLRAQTTEEAGQMLADIRLLLGEHAMVGISSREGNNRAGVGDRFDGNMLALNTRIMRLWGLRVADWLEMEHGRVEVMEDFSVTLQLLESGRTNANMFYYANGQRQTNMAGGCSTYRTHEVQDRSARMLQEQHGADIVRLRQKRNKTDADGLGTRTEVTVMWKRAAEKGRKRAEETGR